ncbi:hypothetical protein CEXT_117601 [Caerostris extrusa]|uniref:Uncharacterized protein n=1 Tax=Caerostris extrusa TaxID=172846 RepID=A0AAV4R0A3_CAEEX|nr:hypothetical protein CEXT_117601 [Caerostris extrusa]
MSLRPRARVKDLRSELEPLYQLGPSIERAPAQGQTNKRSPTSVLKCVCNSSIGGTIGADRPHLATLIKRFRCTPNCHESLFQGYH